ncbi:hypothetical protein AGMMS50225_27300 [Betaproteobacteria bacterium]|nr:hypothetical protein AGMMS50225_27300 [Betaproteobacteria bacterium]
MNTTLITSNATKQTPLMADSQGLSRNGILNVFGRPVFTYARHLGTKPIREGRHMA